MLCFFLFLFSFSSYYLIVTTYSGLLVLDWLLLLLLCHAMIYSKLWSAVDWFLSCLLIDRDRMILPSTGPESAFFSKVEEDDDFWEQYEQREFDSFPGEKLSKHCGTFSQDIHHAQVTNVASGTLATTLSIVSWTSKIIKDDRDE